MVIPEETTKDYREDIMASPRAYNEEGQPLYYSMEYCKINNIVVVWMQNKGWCRGVGGKRYEVISTNKPFDKPFPKFKSGRK